MPGIGRSSFIVGTRYLRAADHVSWSKPSHIARHASDSASPGEAAQDDELAKLQPEENHGAMSKRLQQLSEENLETGGRSAQKAVEEAGFSEELKRQLEDKIANAKFRSENAGAFAQVNLPASAGKDARDIAAAKPWTGTESIEDASFRMLTDGYKPMRSPPKIPSIRGPLPKVDTGRPKSKVGVGTRLASARDRSSYYSLVKDSGLSEQERENFRQQMKQRFHPTGRVTPATIQGLASLANERIEDAISRGQFKNLPRGKKIERDHNANSPFINTTEYFMNKMIQKQDIVPPWIEKQQELVAAATSFRSRLRADWKRHVSRLLASRGGDLESQMKLARECAFAESLENPTKKKIETLNTVDEAGHVSQITIAGELPTQRKEDGLAEEEEIKVMEQTFNDDGSLKPPQEQITVSVEQPRVSSEEEPKHRPTVPPFRDPQWLETERSYLALAIENLNSMTRSYNLMAPNIAKKPYFSLERELRSCYADVAPQVADAIRERALAPKIKGIEVFGHRPGGVLDKFSMGQATKVYDERRPQYGFKEFWRDLFAPKSS